MSDKPKKERTEAQKKATASMLSKLKENREKGVSKPGRKKKEITNSLTVDMPESESEEEVEVVEKPSKVVIKEVIKEVPIEPKYLTREDLHAFKNELASMINPPPPAVQEKAVVKKSKRVLPDESTETPYKPIPKKEIREPASLTGYSLLDKLLNR
jgi:hypothetical protein